MPEEGATAAARRRAPRTAGDAREGPRIELALLGGFALTSGGTPRELPKDVGRLLALLALNPRGLRRSAAARRLAPHLEEESARAGLRKAVSRLRATRLPLIRTDGEALRLHPGVAVDVREAEELAARLADRARPLPEDARHEILTLELLPGWEDGWAERARTGMQGRFLRALDGYARRLVSRGESYRALAVLQQAWESDPLHESTVLALVEIHAGAGDVGQALRAYRAFERQLAAELGLEPTQALRALVEPLLGGRPPS